MNTLGNALKRENGSLRGLTGQGEPGLYTLLGGTGAELDASGYTFGGGPGQTSSATRLARAARDVRLAAVGSGGSVPGGNGQHRPGLDPGDRPGGGRPR